MSVLRIRLFERGDSFVMESPLWGMSSLRPFRLVEAFAELLQTALSKDGVVQVDLVPSLEEVVRDGLRQASLQGGLTAATPESLTFHCPDPRVERDLAVVAGGCLQLAA